LPRPDHSLSLGPAVYRLSVRELLRNRLGLVLLVITPVVFIGIGLVTAGKLVLPIKLYFPGGVEELFLSQRDVMLVFISASVNGFLTAYFALLLFHQDFGYYRYCVFMGLSPSAFVGGRFAFFLTVAAALAAMTTLINAHYIHLAQPWLVFLGFLCLGIIYGSIGGVIGSCSRDFLVALLGIFLLADLDAGWLQNPGYYSASQENEFIRWLPAHFPTQTVFAAAFADKINYRALVGSGLYVGLAFCLLYVLVRWRLGKVARTNRDVGRSENPL
jgi:hypothetical protein